MDNDILKERVMRIKLGRDMKEGEFLIVDCSPWYEEGQQKTLATVKDILDKEFPLCICRGDEVNKDCPNELMDGAWTDGINKRLKEEIEKEISAVGK